MKKHGEFTIKTFKDGPNVVSESPKPMTGNIEPGESFKMAEPAYIFPHDITVETLFHYNMTAAFSGASEQAKSYVRDNYSDSIPDWYMLHTRTVFIPSDYRNEDRYSYTFRIYAGRPE